MRPLAKISRAAYGSSTNSHDSPDKEEFALRARYSILSLSLFVSDSLTYYYQASDRSKFCETAFISSRARANSRCRLIKRDSHNFA